MLDTRSLKGTLKPLTPGHHHLRLHNHRRRAEDAGHRADTVVGPRETPRFLLGALVLEGRRQEGRGGESGREREAVSLNGKDRLSLQLSLITSQPFCSLSCHHSPSPEQAEEACSRAQRGTGRLPGTLPMWPRRVVGAGRRWPAGTRRHGRPQQADGEIHGTCAVVLVRGMEGSARLRPVESCWCAVQQPWLAMMV